MMKFIAILLLAGWHSAAAQIRVYVFLSPECPLCQNYTRTLNQLDQQYAGKVAFYGIIPGKTWKPSDITDFSRKYHIAFQLQQDRDLKFSHSMGATTTPEAILLDAKGGVLYKGAIDNWYKTLGKPGARPTQHYLMDAIDYTLRNQAPPVSHTEPIGCLINDF